jgi:hemoglobin/transferrin/lactoferrin receptor protein
MMKRFKISICLFNLIFALVFLGQVQSMAAEQMDNIQLMKAEIVVAQKTAEEIEKVEEKKEMEEPLRIEEIVVTATRTERTVDMTSMPVTIINSETIETSNSISVLELLDREVPGISISKGGPIGGQLSVRGFNSNNMKSPLFIDGDRFHGRNTLEYMLFDPDRIERIEVIRGPASAMYGTDAMAGLINVITRKAKGDVSGPFKLSPRLRSLNYSSANNLRGGRLELEGLGNGFDMLLGVSGKKADDYESPEGDIPNSDMQSSSVDLRLGYTPAQDHRIELSAKYADVEQGYAGGLSVAPGYPYKTRRDDPLREKMVKLHYEGLNNALNLKHIEASIYARYLYTDVYVQVRPKVNPSSSLTKSTMYVDGPLSIGGKLFGVRSWGGNNTLTIGMDCFRDDRDTLKQDIIKYDSSGNITSITLDKEASPAETQTNIGLFLHNDWDPSEKWTISASGRADYFKTTADTAAGYTGSDESTETPITGGLGLIYRPVNIIHFTANANTSYRVPIPFEKFGTLLGYEPNPDLKPEKGITYEVGARLRLPKIKANLTAFQSDYEDLITRTLVDSTIYPGTTAQQAQNIGEATIKGIEFDATWMVNSNWKAFMNAAYLHGTDTKTDTPLAYIAPLNGLVGVRYTPTSKDFYIEVTDRWSTRKDRIDTTQERETAAYSVLNLYGGFSLRKISTALPDMELRMAVENILDKTYRSPVTPENISYDESLTNPLLEPGRCFSVSLKSRF